MKENRLSIASVAIGNMGEFMGPPFSLGVSKTIVKENRLSIASVAIINMGGIWGGGRWGRTPPS